MKFIYAYLLATLFFCFTQNESCAQNLLIIKGRVIDSKTGLGIPYGYVKLQDLAIGTATNENGYFDLAISSSYSSNKLEFRYVGYKKVIVLCSEAASNKKLVIELKKELSNIKEVVVNVEKSRSAKSILKHAILKIDENYSVSPVYLDGYYRETLTENGATIKYADADCKFHYDGYHNKKYKFDDYDYGRGTYFALNNIHVTSDNTLHRSHFHYRTGKLDQVKITRARSSDNLSKKNMDANIEGGPLGIFSKDKVKFHASFLNIKNLKNYNFSMRSEFDSNSNWYYIIKFKTKATPELLDEMKPGVRKEQWKYADKHKLLEGVIHVDEKSLAITYFDCHVPNELKKYFCGYITMSIKHFDYKVKAQYKKQDGKYHVESIRHEDEFIYIDTILNTTTPYSAVSELKSV